MAVYVTGDTHGDFFRFANKLDRDMQEGDTVIICGDFGGVWFTDHPADEAGRNEEEWRMKWFTKKPYTVLFVDGNHENHARLNGYPVSEYKGGKIHEIAENVYHLMRGQVYTIEGKTFFTFGGASSHDIQDGILYAKDYADRKSMLKDYNRRTKNGEMLRIDGVSWWKEELPTEEEMLNGLKNLEKHGNKVDFIITHSPPKRICSKFFFDDSDVLTEYLDEIAENVQFGEWWSGHLHMERYGIYEKYNIIYYDRVRIV